MNNQKSPSTGLIRKSLLRVFNFEHPEYLPSFDQSLKINKHTVMKNLKIFSLFIALGLVVSTNVNAQTSSNVTVAAEVVTALTVNTTQNISLGTIQAGLASTIAAGASDNVTSEANLGVTTTSGNVTIAGNPSAAVTVDFSNAILTEFTTPATEFAFTTIAYSPELDGGAGLFASGATINLDGSGDASIQLGGTLAAPSAGSFSTANGGNGSPITVTVTYQ